MSAGERLWITAAEAAKLLRVSRGTLYAYVSRGFVRSEAVPGSSRERRYSRDDLERLRRRSEDRRDPDKAAARALHWGLPILESSIALIDGEHLYYRGHDAVALARSRSVADVASLIWTGGFGVTFTDPRGMRSIGSTGKRLPFVAQAQSVLALASTRDLTAADLRPASVASCGWRILRLMTAAAARPSSAEPAIDAALARAWQVSGRGGDLLRAALILCADHELNVSAFAARCVASAGSNPYAVVIGGLAALEGTRHGGISARVEAMLTSLRGSRRLQSAIDERLRRGDRIEGFGHPLYPLGDPRALALIAMLQERYAKSADLTFVLDVAAAAGAATGQQPTVDFALAALTRVLRLPPGSPLTLFAIGRTIGWIGHAIEQYATGQLIRPRAKYVGVMPEAR